MPTPRSTNIRTRVKRYPIRAPRGKQLLVGNTLEREVLHFQLDLTATGILHHMDIIDTKVHQLEAVALAWSLNQSLMSILEHVAAMPHQILLD